jgi:hypothetical protein
MRVKPNKKAITALVGLATTGTVCVGAYKYYNVFINFCFCFKIFEI